MSEVKGIYETHITVSETDEYNFRVWCWKNGYKPIKAVSKRGENPRQLMFSKFRHNTYEYVVDNALKIKKELEKEGMTVLRTKVEANMNNPVVKADERHADNYYEFHFKPIVKTTEEWDAVDKLCDTLSGDNWDVAYSMNTVKKDIYPIVTIRVYKCTREEALEVKDEVFEQFKKWNLKTNDEIQREYSVYDDNQDLDKGWIMVASDL